MRQVNFPAPMGGESTDSRLTDALRQIEDASREDALTIADGFTVSNVTANTTLDPTTCTLPQLAQFVATFFDQLQKRGPNRVE